MDQQVYGTKITSATHAAAAPENSHLAKEAKASFAHKFIEVSRMEGASADEKVQIFKAQTQTLQHFLGLEAGDDSRRSYAQASETLKNVMVDGIRNAIAESGEHGAADMAQRAKHIDNSTTDTALKDLFTIFTPEQQIGKRPPAMGR